MYYLTRVTLDQLPCTTDPVAGGGSRTTQSQREVHPSHHATLRQLGFSGQSQQQLLDTPSPLVCQLAYARLSNCAYLVCHIFYCLSSVSGYVIIVRYTQKY